MALKYYTSTSTQAKNPCLTSAIYEDYYEYYYHYNYYNYYYYYYYYYFVCALE